MSVRVVVATFSQIFSVAKEWWQNISKQFEENINWGFPKLHFLWDFTLLCLYQPFLPHLKHTNQLLRVRALFLKTAVASASERLFQSRRALTHVRDRLGTYMYEMH